MPTKPEIAFIGLGAMGFGMATHLVKQGYPVTGFDVWLPTLERFRAAGGKTGLTPAETVREKDYVVCMVATAAQAQSVLLDGENPAIDGLAQNASLLLCSTVPCAYVQSLAEALDARGRGDVLLVDCPVSGGTGRAADGTLSIMAGASKNGALEKADFLLKELSDPAKLYIASAGIGGGSNMKMVHQVLAAVGILVTSEAMGFAAHLGLDMSQETLDAVQNSDARAWMFGHRAPRILTEFKPIASAITIILKDSGIVTSEAAQAGFPVPMTGVAEQVYLSAVGRGYGPDDDSSLIRLYAEGVDMTAAAKTLSEEEKTPKLKLVQSLLKGIYTCAAAESLAFAKKCGLDLDQVFELCINAAGGSTIFETVGPQIIKVLQGEPAESASPSASGESLWDAAAELQEAVTEAQRLKCPLFLGTQAINLMRLALQNAHASDKVLPRAMIVNVWASVI
ncbi:NAD binding domain of 6-phosphogluconate dehydrogenase-domain-containing protein [Xylariaceae sp. FL0255]|nr:NAD binding domain of 6-phosphogluconate dehydrogenase-domain-containing protein [Xylariaceae sp. FL0255]